jgi:hypothetical protein
VLKFDNTVGTNNIHPVVTFVGAGGGLGEFLDLQAISLSLFRGVIANFGPNEGIKVAAANHTSLDASGTVMTVFDSANLSLGTITFATSQTGKSFQVVTGGEIITTTANYADSPNGVFVDLDALAYGDLEQYPLSVISALAERAVAALVPR